MSAGPTTDEEREDFTAWRADRDRREAAKRAEERRVREAEEARHAAHVRAWREKVDDIEANVRKNFEVMLTQLARVGFDPDFEGPPLAAGETLGAGDRESGRGRRADALAILRRVLRREGALGADGRTEGMPPVLRPGGALWMEDHQLRKEMRRMLREPGDE